MIEQGRAFLAIALVALACSAACKLENPQPTSRAAASALPPTGNARTALALVALPSSASIAVAGRTLTAFGPSGAQLWLYNVPPPDRLIAAPAAAPNSYVYLRGERSIQALNPDGRLLWTTDIGTQVGSLPELTVLTDSSVVAMLGDTVLTCISPAGALRWSFTIPNAGSLVAAPVSSPNGFLLLRTADAVHALNSQGELQWSATLPAPG